MMLLIRYAAIFETVFLAGAVWWLSRYHIPATDLKGRETLTELFDFHCQLSDHAQKLYATEEAWRGMEIMDIADLIGGVIDTLTERLGYTLDEVIEPLLRPERRS